MALELEGKMKAILPLREGEGRNGHWTSQEFVIDIPGQYERMACFTVFNGRCDINAFAIGEYVKVSFDVSAREYQGRYYTSLTAWKIEKPSEAGAPAAGGYPTAAPTAAPAAAAPAGPAEQQPAGGSSDDLPF